MGKIIEVPTKSNYREGLNIFEYVISARGARKGLTDSALKTADAGYLTRRLHDVAHDMIVREKDCQGSKGLTVTSSGQRGDKMPQRILGRYALDLSTQKPVEIGVPAGVIAAQSIGEPGTQLTMRVRHFGGIVISDVTQGLPRVEELFETR